MMKYFSIIMAIFYFALAVTVAFTPLFGGVAADTRYIFAGMLFIYGCFRFYRIFATRNDEA